MVKLDELKKYIDFLSQTDIEELEITTPDGEKILLRRSELPSSMLKTETQEKNIQQKNVDIEKQKEEKKVEENLFVITSPMVGKFLLSPSKDHPPFVVENVAVKQGQKVAIIETMRIFRDVVSPKNGVVKKILAEDGQYVEYGQPLIELELKE